jgi:hypothetical protein
MTVVERYNTDGIKYPVPVITIFQSLIQRLMKTVKYYAMEYRVQSIQKLE